jgi:hypothetical protein
MGRNDQAAFFFCSVNLRWNVQAVPMYVLRHVRVIDDMNVDWLAFSQPNQWTGNGAVVRFGLVNAPRSYFV